MGEENSEVQRDQTIYTLETNYTYLQRHIVTRLLNPPTIVAGQHRTEEQLISTSPCELLEVRAVADPCWEGTYMSSGIGIHVQLPQVHA
jgi:hypothetical protein